MKRKSRMSGGWVLSATLAWVAPGLATTPPAYDVLITEGTIYDGSGRAPFAGEIAIQGDQIVYVGARAPRRAAARVVRAQGLAVAPGFINMLAHPEESLIQDGRALSDLSQGVTLEIMGEDSMGPLTPDMRRLMVERERDIARAR
jgi:N-acyl-D-amino-acid deacylase